MSLSFSSLQGSSFGFLTTPSWHIQQHVPVPADNQHVHTAIEEECTNIPQATINNLINSMRKRCVALREANGGQTIFERNRPFVYIEKILDI